jgi:alkanesulfonate monooxygenase SsuD/methylene tetrahydromethanopterin reductase-like flavin-dependent oxidoreductase (luciferase family)
MTDPKTWKQHKSEFEAGAKAAGKNPQEMSVLVEQCVVVGSRNDAEAGAVRYPQEIQQRAENEIRLDIVCQDWPVSTEGSAHLKVINELFDSSQADRKRVVDFSGSEVMPHLKRLKTGGA